MIGLPDALCHLLRQHHATQDAERAAAGQLWTDEGWLFATETGQPLNPRTDWDRWKKLLTAAGVRDGRLHDARHTAATVLPLLGVSDRAIMGIMGWSNPAMAGRYAHIVDTIRADIAHRVDGLTWATEPAAGDPQQASATDRNRGQLRPEMRPEPKNGGPATQAEPPSSP